MPVDALAISPVLVAGTIGLFKVLYVAFAILYFIFALIVIRQVSLMTETVMTEGGAFLRVLSIIHAGLALGLVVLFIGFL